MKAPLGRAAALGLEWLMRGFFGWLYTRGAWAYSAVAWLVSAGRWVQWVQWAARQVPPTARVLELGFGPGYAQAVWAARGQPAWGVDLSPFMARRAAARVRAQGHRPRVVRARAQALPWPAASVDWVFSTFPAPYIADPATAQEVARVLRPGGQLWVLTAAQGGLLTAWSRVAQWALRQTHGSPASWGQVLVARYAAVGLPGQLVWEPLPGGARGAWFRAVKERPPA